MRNRLIYYHMKSEGNLKQLYQQVLEDPPLLQALCRQNIRMPYEANLFSFPSEPSLDEPPFIPQLSHHPKKQYSDIHIITIFDPHYPQLLKNIFNPPLVLYAKGNLAYLNLPCISVIGTRAPSPEAYPIVQNLLLPLAQSEICIVSGLANGVDTFAHLVADDLNGQTIAVLGGGFRHIYPKSNVYLATQIQERHLLLSEYPPNVVPRKWRFVERNRIIAGISMATVVIEAREKSGTLITAQIALEEGREVFAVPGSILYEHSAGCNRLIQEGANLVCDGKEILGLCKWSNF